MVLITLPTIFLHAYAFISHPPTKSLTFLKVINLLCHHHRQHAPRSKNFSNDNVKSAINTYRFAFPTPAIIRPAFVIEAHAATPKDISREIDINETFDRLEIKLNTLQFSRDTKRESMTRFIRHMTMLSRTPTAPEIESSLMNIRECLLRRETKGN